MRLPNYAATALTEVDKGILESLVVNINGSNVPVLIDVQRIGAIHPGRRAQGVIDTVQGRTGSADITVSERTLDVGAHHQPWRHHADEHGGDRRSQRAVA